MAGTLSRSEVDKFYESLSRRSRFKLYAAIFFLLAPVGLLASSQFAGDRPPWAIAAHVTLSGLAAVGWAAAFIYRLRLLFIVVPIHLVAFWVLERFDPSAPGLVGVVGIVLIGLGYVFFISFINGEGVSKLRLQTEMTLAQDIHRDLVPALSVTGTRLELYGRSAPSSAMGGDLIDAIERDDQTILCVADVAGHGVPAGVVLGMVKAALRTQLLGRERTGSMLSDLDQVLSGILRPGMFVTCVVVAIDHATTAYASAGHPPPLRYDARSGAVQRLSESGLPLGAGVQPRHQAAPGFEWHPFEFLAGDLLVLLTDGITEVFDRSGSALGLDPIEAIISQDPRAPLATIYERIEQASRRHGPQADDQTMLLVRRIG